MARSLDGRSYLSLMFPTIARQSRFQDLPGIPDETTEQPHILVIDGDLLLTESTRPSLERTTGTFGPVLAFLGSSSPPCSSSRIDGYLLPSNEDILYGSMLPAVRKNRSGSSDMFAEQEST